MAKRECGLCREAEKQPPDELVFLLKDNNPRKPNRWLALPRAHAHSLAEMTPAQRVAVWKAAMAKAQELWGDQWALAVNDVMRRSQCHIHVHIGKLLENAETPNFVIVNGPEEIPVPPEDGGVWVHPAGGKLHVHTGEDAPETLLMR